MILFLKIIFSYFPPNIKLKYYSPNLTLNQFISESFFININFLMDFIRKMTFIFFFIEGYFFLIKNIT
tara:strand:- start:752 stop:955 length:204 start_codon:yes stop_codon:yes gene_type:complete